MSTPIVGRNGVVKKAGTAVTSQNRREIDKTIHKLVGVDFANCPAAWKQVKKRVEENEDRFVSDLRSAWINRE
jgi:uncharacterized protein (DUF362 family)